MIAISYRRQDSSPVAGRLYDRLQAEFGKGTVFMDFDSIPYGVDFREHIKTTLQRAKVVVAIIGPEWTGGHDKSNRRIDDPTDFVRLEIASALENGIPIIPVLINNTPMPEAKTLPAELEGLAFRNGLALDTGIDFHHHADRLIAGIHRVVDPPIPPALPVTTPVPPKAEATSPRRFPMVATLAALVLLAGIAAWYFSIRMPNKTAIRQETAALPRSSAEPSANSQAAVSPTIAPTPTATATASIAVAESDSAKKFTPSPPAVAPVPDARNSEASENTVREYTFTGKVGTKEATFLLRFEPVGRVSGSYSQGGSTYRLEGRHPKGKLLLEEFTGDRLTAHIEVLLVESAGLIRWEGTMRNTPPDNRVLPIFFERSPLNSPTPNVASAPTEASGSFGDYFYTGRVGPYEATFQLRFEPSGRVSGTYSLATNKNLVLRLEGRNPKGRLFLDEYTRDKLTARIELSLIDSASDIKWEGTMYNTPPDNRVFPVSFSRPRK